MVHIIIDGSHIHSKHTGSDEIHGGGFCLYILFGGGLPPTLAIGPIVFSLALCGGMAEHPIEHVGPLQDLQPPLQELIKKDVSIHSPL